MLPAGDAPPTLILELIGEREVQATAWGEAHRRVPRLLEVPAEAEHYPELISELSGPAPTA